MTLRDAIKAAVRAAATIAIAPLLLLWWAQGRLIGRDRALQNATQLLALIPGLTGQYLRRAFLGRTLEHFDRTATAEFGTTFSRAAARVEADAYIGPMCHIGLAHIGAGALIGPGVQVPSGPKTHGIGDVSAPIREQGGIRSVVRIGPGAWIGGAAVVMADVGRDSVVGAGAVVTRPVPDRTIAAGVPARVIRRRESDEDGAGPGGVDPGEGSPASREGRAR
jgi:virginiamycin A acetyltransferase